MTPIFESYIVERTSIWPRIALIHRIRWVEGNQENGMEEMQEPYEKGEYPQWKQDEIRKALMRYFEARTK